MADIVPSHEETAEAASVAAPEAAKADPGKSYYYCQEEGHPGAPNFQTTPLSLNRIFAVDKGTEGAPVCPACQKQTNSVPCEGPDIPPESVISLQERFGR